MANDIMIPDQLPSYLATAEAMGTNDEAMSGLSLGGFPYIKLNGTRFMAVEGDSEISIPVMELPVVIMRAMPGLKKQWYATKYNPNSADPGKSPDCFSFDGAAPNPQSPSPQSKTCAACPHNAFGSGKDQEGKPTKGKACGDFKQVAVFTQAPSKAGAENYVYGMRLPPASLKGFAQYVKALSSKRVPLAAALTVVSFDPKASYPVLEFKFGGLLNEQQYAMIQEKAASDEVEAIITPTAFTPSLPATTAPAATTPEVSQPVAAPEPAPAAPAASVDLGLGDMGMTPQAAPAAEKAKVVNMAPAAPAPEPEAASNTSDDDLAKQLGLM